MTGNGRFRLGQTEIEVSPMGLGTWAWGDRLVWGFGRGYGEAEVRAAHRARPPPRGAPRRGPPGPRPAGRPEPPGGPKLRSVSSPLPVPADFHRNLDERHG